MSADELNNWYTEYFDIMDISNEQKLERIELAELLDDVFIYLFTYFYPDIEKGVYNLEKMYSQTITRYKDALENYGIDFNKYPEIEEYVEKVSRDIVDSSVSAKSKSSSNTQNNGANKPKQTLNANKVDNMSSTDQKSLEIQNRAITVSQNESNTIFNTKEYYDAILKGYTHKTWITEEDDKVRSTHKDVDRTRIPIDEYFYVGNSQMLYPHDYSSGADAKELVNCRCSVWYDGILLKNKNNSDNIIQNNFIELNLQLFADKDKQYGKKIGKHARDYGLDPSKEEDRQWIYNKVDEIVSSPDKIKIGSFRGQKDEVLFHLKGEDVIITKQDGEFVTILKGGVNNGGFKNAREYGV